MDGQKRKVVFSGVQPSGKITIGNYLGAIKNWQPHLDVYDCLFCIVDMHAITVAQQPQELRQNSLLLAAQYIACGIDPNKASIFIQSHVSAHAELQWVLDTVSYVGELSRMTQFKDKSKKHADNINMGLMNYPVLMASDILLYQTDFVPVGKDQTQHLELARNLAERFNNRFSPTFVVPQPLIAKVGNSIKSLQDPAHQMSKSDENLNAVIFVSDDADTVRRKFKRAVTDSETEIKFTANKPAISNLLTIYSLASGVSVADAEKQFAGSGYGEFKDAVAESVIAMLTPIQKETERLLTEKDFLLGVLKLGAEKAHYTAQKTLDKVYRKVGFVPRIR